MQQYDELADLTQNKKMSQAASDGTYGYLKLRVLGDELRDVIQAMDVKVVPKVFYILANYIRAIKSRF